MAGDPHTNSFMIGTATVMIGPQARVFDMNPTDHSIGLVKNFQMSSEPNQLDLTHGVHADVVDSIDTTNNVRAQCEVYEYTSKNFAYGMGLDGYAMKNLPMGPFPFVLLSAVVGSDTNPVTTLTFQWDGTHTSPEGSWWALQHPTDKDQVKYFRLAADSTYGSNGSVATLTTTDATAFKVGANFPVGSKLSAVNMLPIGSTNQRPYFALAVTAIMPHDSKPVSLLLPKVRITRGFSATFGETAYGNMPFQFTPYKLLPAEPNYGMFKEFNGYGMLMSST